MAGSSAWREHASSRSKRRARRWSLRMYVRVAGLAAHCVYAVPWCDRVWRSQPIETRSVLGSPCSQWKNSRTWRSPQITGSGRSGSSSAAAHASCPGRARRQRVANAGHIAPSSSGRARNEYELAPTTWSGAEFTLSQGRGAASDPGCVPHRPRLSSTAAGETLRCCRTRLCCSLGRSGVEVVRHVVAIQDAVKHGIKRGWGCRRYRSGRDLGRRLAREFAP